MNKEYAIPIKNLLELYGLDIQTYAIENTFSETDYNFEEIEKEIISYLCQNINLQEIFEEATKDQQNINDELILKKTQKLVEEHMKELLILFIQSKYYDTHLYLLKKFFDQTITIFFYFVSSSILIGLSIKSYEYIKWLTDNNIIYVNSFYYLVGIYTLISLTKSTSLLFSGIRNESKNKKNKGTRYFNPLSLNRYRKNLLVPIQKVKNQQNLINLYPKNYVEQKKAVG